MYLKEKTIRILKIKNVVLTILAVGMLITCLYDVFDLLTYYRDDLDTAWHADTMKYSICFSIISVIVILVTELSRRMMYRATFYSSYFEGSLDGYIRFEDLAKVVGRPIWSVCWELRIYRMLYMNRYTLMPDNQDHQIELFSKRVSCECKNCGAQIEKREYFTGHCNSCGSSDLHAKVIAGDRFYSISSEVEQGVNRPSFYKDKHLKSKNVLFIILMALGLLVAIIMTFYVIDMVSKYNDSEYITAQLLDSSNQLYSVDLVKKDMVQRMVFGTIIGTCMYVLVLRRVRRIRLIQATDDFSRIFARSNKPFLPSKDIQGYADQHGIRKVRNSIRMNYLQHCTLEIHEEMLQVALAKKIVKDTCPSCASPIVGAVDEEYVCQYCGHRIMGVIEKGDPR